MQTTNPGKIAVILKAILFCIVFTGIFIAFSFAKNFLPVSLERLSHGIIGTVAAFLATFLFLKFDRKCFSDIELYFERKTVTRFLVGVLVGIVIMGFLATAVMYFNHTAIHFNPKANLLHFFLATAPLIPLAYMEEVGFRAYPLQILKDKTGIRLAIIVTSILFALYHIVNGWSIQSSFLGPAVWGLLFGLSAIYSKGIAMPTGIHFAANLTTSAFGTGDSSITVWTIQPATGITTRPYGIDLTIILPTLFILVLGLIGMEIYSRRKTASAIALAKARVM